MLASGSLATNALFSDGMVLQTSADGPLSNPTIFHGTAEAGETVTLTASPAGFPGAPYSTKASTTGAWSIQLEPDVGLHMSEAPGTFTSLSGSGSTSGAIVAKDVGLVTGGPLPPPVSFLIA